MDFFELVIILMLIIYLILFIFVCTIDCDLKLKFYEKVGGKIGKQETLTLLALLVEIPVSFKTSHYGNTNELQPDFTAR